MTKAPAPTISLREAIQEAQMESRFQQAASLGPMQEKGTKKKKIIRTAAKAVSVKAPTSAKTPRLYKFLRVLTGSKESDGVIFSKHTGRIFGVKRSIDDVIRAALQDTTPSRPAPFIRITPKLRREFVRAVADAKSAPQNLQSYDETLAVIGEKVASVQERLRSKSLTNG